MRRRSSIDGINKTRRSSIDLKHLTVDGSVNNNNSLNNNSNSNKGVNVVKINDESVERSISQSVNRRRSSLSVLTKELGQTVTVNKDIVTVAKKQNIIYKLAKSRYI